MFQSRECCKQGSHEPSRACAVRFDCHGGPKSGASSSTASRPFGEGEKPRPEPSWMESLASFRNDGVSLRSGGSDWSGTRLKCIWSNPQPPDVEERKSESDLPLRASGFGRNRGSPGMACRAACAAIHEPPGQAFSPHPGRSGRPPGARAEGAWLRVWRFGFRPASRPSLAGRASRSSMTEHISDPRRCP